MSLYSAAERLAALDRSTVKLVTSRCLHTQDKFSVCAACFDVCPVEAVTPGKPPVLDTKECQTCLACLPACPTGAYTADDAVSALLNCAGRVENDLIELVCNAMPQSDLGVASTGIAIQVRGCLSGLGSGAYLALAALGLHNILARLDACDECPWGALQPQIEKQIKEAQRLLEPPGLSTRLSYVKELKTERLHERPVWDADNPPLSRRDLFRLVSRQTQIAAARAMSANEPATQQQIPGRNHRRIIAALEHIKPGEPAKEGLSLEGLGYAMLSVSDECTACGVCARSCPTGALIYTRNKEELHFSLEFEPDQCIACQVCLHVCPPDAISADNAPRFEDVFCINDPIMLCEGSLTRCEQCGIYMAARSDSYVCALCEHRRKSPFGSKLPPGFKGKDITTLGID